MVSTRTRTITRIPREESDILNGGSKSMSGKNRAFALAIATAALVGFSAPMAMAATTYGPSNTGFNNDSVLNLSNNQLSNQTCTGGVQTGVSAAAQTITS